MTTTSSALAQCSVARGVQGLADEFREIAEAHKTPVAQRCDRCGAGFFPPLLGCRECGSPELSWVSCGVTGTVGTFVTVHTAEATPSMAIPRRLLDKVPYTSVYVVPDALPAVRLPALMLGAQQERLAVGARVRLHDADGRTVHASIADDDAKEGR
ncbi:Zn-ribbon domain-containing OB-fold protein [Saccharopolyspora sp. ASAGF58]|uniref:Zn-ribbon domain-containing OB-fold protein n=1 Tax=Saccharopolyspora sp. ASAGF58 TaxID=2719023 RepID=UPI0014401FB2|nr:zinc ribbon domain-containing protein [Saccharopolyspora sp. ASAGF58]QIZ37991.1 hypothetical protein FDZ84_29755 [Saccharopolyspora sp. ASAGF58]